MFRDDRRVENEVLSINIQVINLYHGSRQQIISWLHRS